MSEPIPSFDFAFIGMGCANSLVFVELHRLGLLENKRILVYEPSEKIANDRTFCFWLEPEKLNAYQLDTLVSFSWNNLKINNLTPKELGNKKYFYLRADVFYAHVKKLLLQYEAVWKAQALDNVNRQLATWVFDSRPPKFQNLKANEVRLHQSFYGCIVQTKEEIFDPQTFTMMDFAIPQQEQTQFLYVLPFTKNQALLEPTRFGQEPITEHEAQNIITDYLAEHKTSYQVLEEEKGCIPMCSGRLQNENLPPNWIRTGAGSGQLKPSTGYSFVRSLIDAQSIVASIQNKTKHIARRKSASRFVFYDRLLLQILAKKPQLGKQIFSQLFEKNHARYILDFLDERSSLLKDLRIMSSLPILPFVVAAFNDLLYQAIYKFKEGNGTILITFLLLIFNIYHLEALSYFCLILGLFTVGIPHGALDHLPNHTFRSSGFWKFIFKYLALGSIMLLLWKFAAPLALVIFLGYTAWHFGQADFDQWKQQTGLASFFWGLFVLGCVLLGHSDQTTLILEQMRINAPLTIHQDLMFIGPIGLGLMAIIAWYYNDRRGHFNMLKTILFLFLATWLPLIQAFGVYFVFQHSLYGWGHLKNKLEMTTLQMWKQALPFTLGAFMLFALYYAMNPDPNWGLVFIFLSALSFPHVWYMHQSYLEHKEP